MLTCGLDGSTAQEIIEQINENTTNIGGGQVPLGGVIMFFGLVANIPAQYALCDGSNGTPNLIDQFVMGTVIEEDIGSSGGTADQINVSHNHTFSGVTLPSHNHTLLKAASTGAGGIQPWGYAGTSAQLNIQGASAGTPSGTISTEGESGTGLNIPPFVKLGYIMRII